LRLSGQ